MESEQLFPLTSEKISVSRLIGTPSFKCQHVELLDH
jgi:hypothetical protein